MASCQWIKSTESFQMTLTTKICDYNVDPYSASEMMLIDLK
jgi:hypothetical protein